MTLKETVLSVYDKQYKPLMLVPFVLLVLALLVLGVSYARTGDFITKGVSIKGGITLTFEPQGDVDIDALEASLAKTVTGDLNVRGLTDGGKTSYVVIEASDIEETALIAALKDAGILLQQGSYSIENVGSSMGNDFFRQMLYAVVAAFIGISIVVFITFRNPVPSAFAVLAVICTMIMTLATCNLLGVRLSTAGVAAFLMLIGYSIDTDILLTSRVMKNKEGSIFDRVKTATVTGLTMTLTALAATIVGYLFTQSDTIRQIMLILSIGLFYDMVNTWLQNAAILRWYMERKGERHG